MEIVLVVLILVVMEDALAPHLKNISSHQRVVLILVVMEDALALSIKDIPSDMLRS